MRNLLLPAILIVLTCNACGGGPVIGYGELTLRDTSYTSIIGMWRGTCDGLDAWAHEVITSEMYITRTLEGDVFEAVGTFTFNNRPLTNVEFIGHSIDISGEPGYSFDGDMYEDFDGQHWRVTMHIRSINSQELGGSLRQVVSSYQHDLMCSFFWYRAQPLSWH